MQSSRQEQFNRIAAELGYSFEGEIRIGGRYVSVVAHERTVYVSGQLPRVGDTVIATGRVGAETTLEQAQRGAQVSVLRALALLRQSLGSLDRIERILRVGVYVQSAPDFVAQSEVADAASDVLYAVLGPAGSHTRTSVGVYQLPKNAAVEIDLVASATAGAGDGA
ncbi:RidA family protein [Variovorax terrae]|uniref:RidA family protein n=1 Tax=Variovorax terrae TaxID=2923278 RepID=A0A9X1VXS3_9BURK|nr:RidA family protein [Variovorax terrae]MCJ0765265.1 RidA family protein [Variovorax terrae]